MAYLSVNKPAGCRTASRGDVQGMADYVSRDSGERLRAPVDLDTDASGAVAYARTARAEIELAGLFLAGQVRQLFLAVTDRPTPPDLVSASGRDAAAEDPVFRRREPPNGGPFTMWEIVTFTQNAQQIRQRAAQLGIHLLGDTTHGGSAYPRLMLHCAEIAFQSAFAGEVRHTVPLPPSFRRIGRPGRGSLAAWLAAFDRRHALFEFDATSAIRLLHTDGEGVRCDRLGPVCWFYWYRQRPPDEDDLADVAALVDEAGAGHWKVHYMSDRGDDPQRRQRWSSDDGMGSWEGTEHGLRYRFKADQGLSPGLFLDQRRNRAWVAGHSAGRRVLNLFSYTGGFGVCAADGGAAEIVNVDTSQRTLDWSRENFALNELDTDAVEFCPVDAGRFLEGCGKRGRDFDLIICDPPSFSRGREGVFRVDRDLWALLQRAVEVLAPGGDLLVSVNYESWDAVRFRHLVRAAVPEHIDVQAAPSPDWDFELPGQEPLLKSLILTRS